MSRLDSLYEVEEVEEVEEVQQPNQEKPEEFGKIEEDNSWGKVEDIEPTQLPTPEVEKGFKSDSETLHTEPVKVTEEGKSSNLNIVKENNLLDDFMLDLGDYYQPEDMDSYSFLDNKDNEIYSEYASQGSVEEAINNAFQVDGEKVSFSTEELGLHNRLSEINGIIRDCNNYVLIKTEKGDVVVDKSRVRANSEAVRSVLDDIKKCISKGIRIDVSLLESFTVELSPNFVVERNRFRVSLAEVKEIIAKTKMKGIITKDCRLVIYE